MGRLDLNKPVLVYIRPCLVLWPVLSGLVVSLGWGESFLICSQPILLPPHTPPGWDLLLRRQEMEPTVVVSQALWPAHMKEAGTEVLTPIFIPLADTFKHLTTI